MNEQFSLKGDRAWTIAKAIEKELYEETGQEPITRRFVHTTEGYKVESVVDINAFYRVCVKLHQARAELERERAKKWWKFWE